MNLAELKEAYKARKLALDSAKKEEEKYKVLLKDAMLEAGESDYTDEAGYRFERIVQERKSMDEEKLLAELHQHCASLWHGSDISEAGDHVEWCHFGKSGQWRDCEPVRSGDLYRDRRGRNNEDLQSDGCHFRAAQE